MSLFTTKYAPQNSEAIVGQSFAISLLKNFILHYKQQKHKAALLYGSIGVGKTSSVYALAKELGYDLLELNSSDFRDEASITSFLSSALGQQSLFFTPKIILIDEIDNISGREDRGCIGAIVKGLEKSRFPVILTANDPFDSKFKPLQKISLMIEYPKPDYKTVVSLLREIAKEEKISAEEKALSALARRADGDIRGALIDLQLCSAEKKCLYTEVLTLSDRKRTSSILQALTLIFKSSSVENARPALEDVDAEMNEIFLWLDENLPKEYSSPQALAKAYEHLARADVFQGRITRQQHWRFLAYINDLLTAGISSAKEVKNPHFVEYRPTMRILRLWQAKMKYAQKKEIAAKLASATHTSKKVAISQIPFLQIIFQKSPAIEIRKELNLDEEEVEWLKK